MKTLEITITAPVPDEELGHEAIVAAKEPVAAVAAVLEGLGLKVEQRRRLVSRRDEKKAPASPKLVA